MFTFACVDELVELLEAGGLQADTDPSNLNLPAAWVTVDQIVPSTLVGDWQVQAFVYLVTNDQDTQRATERLAELFQLFLDADLSPDGPVRPQGVLMPDTSTPLPALRVPIYLYT